MSATQLPSSHVSDASRDVWVNPLDLPDSYHPFDISGNAPDLVKRLNYNTFMSYGVGDENSFGHLVGKAVKFVDVSLERNLDRCGRMEATTIAELTVNKYMLNGRRMLHGGALAYLIDNCASTPLVVLGLVSDVNGVGVTSNMSIQFHSPAPQGTRLRIVSSSVTLGTRVMSARCEIFAVDSGRMVASGSLNKMQPTMAKL
ncbi:HotDog domain-containing protein [Flagelloscypha sp. PMI_526]|nr:HotDog domain-containing protein [Flagelloscypha sp. PMI_526]